MIRLTTPAWLLLLIPLWLLFARRYAGRPVARWLGLAASACLLLALADPVVRLRAREGIIVVVADRSASMPDTAADVQQEWVRRLEQAMPARSQLGVIAFAEQVVVEQAPQGAGFGGFVGQLDGHASNLADAIDTALALVPPDAAARLLLLSDGLHTGTDPMHAALNAMARGIPIDTRTQPRPAAGDVAIAAFEVPPEPHPGERIVLNAWLQSPGPGTLPYRLERNGQRIAEGERRVRGGRERLQFVDEAPESGVLRYTLTLTPQPDDPVPENNRARALARVRESQKPLLCLSPAPRSGLVDLLRRGGIAVAPMRPEAFDGSLTTLAGYSGVLIENVPADAIGRPALAGVAAWVRELGGGLMTTGGRQAYGAGGYFQSPLDPILPVSMEMRREHRQFSLAVVIVMDRSGSMAMPAGTPGRSKMDLANLGCIQVLDLLSDGDSMGVLAVDTAVHAIVPLAPLADARAQRNKILGIRSQGGGIYVYTGLRAAGRMLADSEAGARHVILFADAADAEEPGGYIELLEQFSRAGITCSVVGLGTEQDRDAEFLHDIAARGQGEIYFTQDAEEIPRIFAQDTMTVTRQAFVEEPAPVHMRPGWSLLSRTPLAAPPPVGGYNQTYLRADATVAMRTADERQAPLLAFWQAGAGRVLAFTGEADGSFAGPFAHGAQAGEFYATAARWTCGESDADLGYVLRSRIEDDALAVDLHLDPDLPERPAAATPQLVVLREQPGREPQRDEMPFHWSGPARLSARMPLLGPETALAAVRIPGQPPVILPPTSLPYNPEYRPRDPAEGRRLLRRLAHATGGIERADLGGAWHTLRTERAPRRLAPFFTLLSALFFLIGILERRTGIVSSQAQARIPVRRHDENPAVDPIANSTAPRPAPIPTRPDTDPDAAPPDSESALTALRDARQRAHRRFTRK